MNLHEYLTGYRYGSARVFYYGTQALLSELRRETTERLTLTPSYLAGMTDAALSAAQGWRS